MKRRYHRWYSRTYSLNERLTRALTTQGQALFIVAFALMFFGLNTGVSMLYVVFAIIVSLLMLDRLSLFFKIPAVRISRFAPGSVVKGRTAKYKISVRTKESYLKWNTLYYREVPSDPRPGYDEFVSTPEPGEKKRNWFDRKMAYYRWKWIVERNLGAKYPEFTVTGRNIGGEIVFDIEMTPYRRGKIRLSGSFIYVKGIFGLFQKGRIIENPGEITVLPEIFPIEKVDFFDGSVESSSENTRETEETGSGYELKSLREYVPGDSPRFIHWKSSAKTGVLKVREHHKEVDAGTVLFVDNFIDESFSEDFEGSVSIAASFLDYFSAVNMMPNMLVIGDTVYEIDSNTREKFQELTFALALAGTQREKKITEVFPLISSAGSESGSVLLITPFFDDVRHDFVKKLAALNVSVFPIYVGKRHTKLSPLVNETGFDPSKIAEDIAKL
jgi:uncharacterized protein (DUF58 family)